AHSARTRCHRSMFAANPTPECPKLSALACVTDTRRVSVGLVVGGRYELTARLGRGGFGTVWRGHDAPLRRDAALKLLTGGGEDREAIVPQFWREAQAVGALNQPNIVNAH